TFEYGIQSPAPYRLATPHRVYVNRVPPALRARTPRRAGAPIVPNAAYVGEANPRSGPKPRGAKSKSTRCVRPRASLTTGSRLVYEDRITSRERAARIRCGRSFASRRHACRRATDDERPGRPPRDDRTGRIPQTRSPTCRPERRRFAG